MDTLRTYLNSLPADAQKDFCRRCGTTLGYLRKALSVKQRIRESVCMNIERESGGVVRCEDLRPDLLRQWAYMRNSGNVLRVRRIVRPVAAEAPRAIERKPE